MRVRAPMMRIHTVAAGGGSILHFEPGRFRVGPDFGRRQSGPRLLPPRRPACGDRRQSDAGQAAARPFPRDLRPRQDQQLDADVVRAKFQALADAIGDGRSPEAVAEGLRHHRGREHGERHQEDLGPARLRRHALFAQRLRRRQRPACLPGRRCARHGDGADPPLLRPALGLRHRPVQRLRLAPAGADQAAGAGIGRRDLRAHRRAARTGARRAGRARHRRRRRRLASRPAPSLRRHRHRAAGRFRRWLAGRRAFGLRGGAPRAVRLRLRRQAGDRRNRVGRRQRSTPVEPRGGGSGAARRGRDARASAENLLRGRLAGRRHLPARAAAAGQPRLGSRADRGEPPDHRGRAGLAGRDHGAQSRSAAPG